MKTVDYATIVTPDEMQDARQWLADRLESLTAEGSPHAATIVCKSQGWGTLQTARSVMDGPLCLEGKTYKTAVPQYNSKVLPLRSRPAGAIWLYQQQ